MAKLLLVKQCVISGFDSSKMVILTLKTGMKIKECFLISQRCRI